MQLRSRQHTKISAEKLRPFDLGPLAHPDDEAGPRGLGSERGEHAPAVERGEGEIADDGVETLTGEEIEGRLPVGRDFPLDPKGVGVGIIGPIVHHQHARSHRAPPP